MVWYNRKPSQAAIFGAFLDLGAHPEAKAAQK